VEIKELKDQNTNTKYVIETRSHDKISECDIQLGNGQRSTELLDLRQLKAEF
jgi:hypothetical protein